MKEPFTPQTTISQMLPLAMRHEFFRRVFGQQRLYGYKGIHTVEESPEQRLARIDEKIWAMATIAAEALADRYVTSAPKLANPTLFGPK